MTDVMCLTALDCSILSFLKWHPFLPVFAPVDAEFACYGKQINSDNNRNQATNLEAYLPGRFLSVKTIRAVAINPLLADTTALMISISHCSPIHSLLDKVLSIPSVTHEQTLSAMPASRTDWQCKCLDTLAASCACHWVWQVLPTGACSVLHALFHISGG